MYSAVARVAFGFILPKPGRSFKAILSTRSDCDDVIEPNYLILVFESTSTFFFSSAYYMCTHSRVALVVCPFLRLFSVGKDARMRI